MVKLVKLNESFFQIQSNDKGLLQEIKDRFSFPIENRKYHPLVRQKKWDGIIRLLTYDNKLYLGLLPEAIALLRSNKEEFELVGFDNKEMNISPESVHKFIDGIIVSSGGKEITPHAHQIYALTEAVLNKRVVLLSATACHSKGHGILMYDGTIKPVEKIRVGEFVMGPDSLPREVLKTYSGTGPLVQITPHRNSPFIVNEDHILPMCVYSRKREGKIEQEEISVRDLLTGGKHYRHIRKMIKSGPIEFPEQDVKLSPWLLGILIGDGHLKGRVSFTTSYPELVEFARSEVESFGCKIVKSTKSGTSACDYRFSKPSGCGTQENPISEVLRGYGLFGCKSADKFIPRKYLLNSREKRLQLLAGLIDTDGYIYTTPSPKVEYSTKSEKLATDIEFLCRSLGFHVSVNKRIKRCQNNFSGEYYIIYISGDLSEIPLRKINHIRKISDSIGEKQKTNHRHFGIKEIKSIGNGKFYGFMLDGDHLYLDENFFIHHNSGKSLNVYLYIRWILANEPDRQILLIVPSVQLVYQLYKDFEDYSTINGFEVGEYVQIMHDDCIKEILRPVVIVNVQAIQNQPKEWFLPFDTIIHDEVHRSKAKTFKTILENCINADRRVGLTGTLDGVEVNELVIKGLVGKTKDIISTKELVQSGLGTPLVIKMIMLKYPKKFIPKLKPADYAAEVNFLAAIPERREYIYSLLDSITGNTLVIFSLVEKHLEPMLKEYRKRNPKKKVFVVDGTVLIEKREEIRTILESSDNNVVFCSYGTFSTGINIKNIKNLVMAMGAKSKIRVKQTLGRLVRKHVSKDKAFIYDIVDDLRQGTGGRPNSCFLHGKARLEYYREDGHKVIFKSEEIS